MGKRFPEINPKTGQRVKEVCIDFGITQKELADKIHLSEKTVSSMVRGHSGVTRATAEAIVRCFPEYRIEWLLGIDDMKTKHDKQLWDQAEKGYEDCYTARFDSFREQYVDAINMLAGLGHIEIRECEDGGLILENDFGPEIAARDIDKPIKLSCDAATLLISHITRYIEITLQDCLMSCNMMITNSDRKQISIAPSRYESLIRGCEDVPEEQ